MPARTRKHARSPSHHSTTSSHVVFVSWSLRQATLNALSLIEDFKGILAYFTLCQHCCRVCRITHPTIKVSGGELNRFDSQLSCEKHAQPPILFRSIRFSGDHSSRFVISSWLYLSYKTTNFNPTYSKTRICRRLTLL